jgi:hypothetical protein
MKKFHHFNCTTGLVVLIALLANTGIVSGQTVKEQHFLIPDSINKILQTSCLPCHGNEGGRLPGARLDFSRWEGYSAAEEAEKASLICSTLSKGTMPPRSVRESKPELIPSKEQVDLICKWAESLKSKKKEK